VHNSQLPVVIIGAGPYGLSIAAYLRALGVPLRIFGEPMQSWREHMPRGMALKSEGFASSVYDPEDAFTLMTYCKEAGLPYADVGNPVPLETFVSYGLEFQRRHVPELEHHPVTRLCRAGQSFEVTLSTGETVRAQRVVVATGITHFGYLPLELEGYPPELVSHSSAHSRLDRFRGKTVAVIGAGSSAVDIAALLHEAGADVHLIARRSKIDFHDPPVEPRPLIERIHAPRSGLGIGWRSRLCTDAPLLFHLMPEAFRLKVVKRHLGPAPGWFMKERVVGRFPMYLGAAIRGVEIKDGSLRLTLEGQSAGRTTLEVAHAIAGTGYKPAIRRLPFLADDLRQSIATTDEAPILDRNFECSVPGLYWVGLASANSFGPLTRFAFGARFTARRLTRHLAASLRLDARSTVPVPSSSVVQ
jgi:lysine/ornithine N-monooxygenase